MQGNSLGAGRADSAADALVRRDFQLETAAIRVECHVLGGAHVRVTLELHGFVMQHAEFMLRGPGCQRGYRERKDSARHNACTCVRRSSHSFVLKSPAKAVCVAKRGLHRS